MASGGRSLHGQALSVEEHKGVEEMFETLDGDGSGTISLQEWLSQRSAGVHESLTANMEAFREYDNYEEDDAE